MPKENKELSFGAGFKPETIKGVEYSVYSDPNAFVDSCPVSVDEVKKFHKYENEFNTKFIHACVEDAKKAFEKGDSKKTYRCQNGVNSASHIDVGIVKEHQFTAGFGEEKKTITSPKITVGIKRTGLYNKTEVSKIKDGLKEFVDSL